MRVNVTHAACVMPSGCGGCWLLVFLCLLGFCFWCAAHYSHDECYTSAFSAGMWGPPCDIANEITFKFIQRTLRPELCGIELTSIPLTASTQEIATRRNDIHLTETLSAVVPRVESFSRTIGRTAVGETILI